MRRTPPETVSVLIPTRDASGRFARTLEAIRRQRGVRAVEVVVVDSGSTDGTVALARASGARVLEIPAGEFNHGRPRNQAADASSGDILVVTVQDAVLLGRYALRELVLALRADERLAAITARQVVGPDADLHTRYEIDRHQRALASRGRAPVDRYEHPHERLTGALVDNVCAAYRRSAWSALRFRELDFAEDIDFGLRALDRGWRTGFCSEARVEHHHNRDAGYVLCRSAVNYATVADLIEDEPGLAAAANGVDGVAAGARALLPKVEAAARLALGDRRRVQLPAYLKAVADRFGETAIGVRPSVEFAQLDAVLRALVTPNEECARRLRPKVTAALTDPMLADFGRTVPPVPAAEALRLAAKTTASIVGQVLGDAMRHAPGAPVSKAIRARLGTVPDQPEHAAVPRATLA